MPKGNYQEESNVVKLMIHNFQLIKFILMKRIFLKNKDLELLKSNISKLENPALKSAAIETPTKTPSLCRS